MWSTVSRAKLSTENGESVQVMLRRSLVPGNSVTLPGTKPVPAVTWDLRPGAGLILPDSSRTAGVLLVSDHPMSVA